MRWWKLVGLAGVLAAVAVGGVVLQKRRHRTWVDYPPEELRSKLHERLAASTSSS